MREMPRVMRYTQGEALIPGVRAVMWSRKNPEVRKETLGPFQSGPTPHHDFTFLASRTKRK
jgi:hypothetical protein